MKGYISKGITPEIAANLAELRAMGDENIDLSDIPEVTDWSNAVRGGPFYRPVKQQLTLRLDADLVDWFKTQSGARGYQTRINAALRQFVDAQAKGA